MIKAIRRFFVVLAAAVGVGIGLYFAMHAIQPLVNRLDPEPVEVRPDPSENFNAPRSFYLPDLRDLARGTLSIGRDIFVFAVMTVVVVGIQRRIPKARRPILEPEENADSD